MATLARIPLLVSDPRLPTPRVSMVIPAIGARTAARPENGAEYFLIIVPQMGRTASIASGGQACEAIEGAIETVLILVR